MPCWRPSTGYPPDRRPGDGDAGMGDDLPSLGAEALQVAPAPVDPRLALAGALAGTGPLILGIALGHPHAGLAASLGGLNVALAMPEPGNRHRIWWAVAATVGCIAAAALARAAAPLAPVEVGLTLLWTGGFALLRAAGKDGVIVGFVLSAVFVILGGLPGVGSLLDQIVPFAAGSLVGLGLMLLAGLGRTAGPPRSALSVASLLSTVARAVADDAGLRGHALRVGLATACATALYALLGPSFGYWIPLTVLAVLQPDSHSSRVRLLQRAAGTVVGSLLVVAASLLTDAPLALAVLAALFALALFAVKERSYFWMVILLTPMVLLMIGSGGVEGPALALQRVVNTAIGLAIGLAAMSLPRPGRTAR